MTLLEKPAEPYTKIVEAHPQMRREKVHLVRQAVNEGRHAYVLVNNRWRGQCTVDGAGSLMGCYEARAARKPQAGEDRGG